ncbi:hypothetical protein [Streptomyces sp. NBC_01445]|uniref:hypothetical protein n=1 Tax=Streptomyces sp. NBC_01445 TaxID=2903869 RepID=UPI002DDA9C13|nr:hypothetical protein [Streptomyces sp. NBC_01445]WSE02062.1 hypothetical protein OG574_00620 [Streptomyces sp. NBC_01445]WSE10268.1 hypothetical protein OG574_47390 [Streptomyces sp. NBC_01445]WSE11163.1 hypothetical protein OG574_48630 [Streptomyces sp. NBC_01445]
MGELAHGGRPKVIDDDMLLFAREVHLGVSHALILVIYVPVRVARGARVVRRPPNAGPSAAASPGRLVWVREM